MASTLELQPLPRGDSQSDKTMLDYTSAILYVLDDDGITAVAYRGTLPGMTGDRDARAARGHARLPHSARAPSATHC